MSREVGVHLFVTSFVNSPEGLFTSWESSGCLMVEGVDLNFLLETLKYCLLFFFFYCNHTLFFGLNFIGEELRF